MKTHFKLYEGYVAHINKMIVFLNEADVETQEYDEMKRRFAAVSPPAYVHAG
jgi:hypothetical protein